MSDKQLNLHLYLEDLENRINGDMEEEIRAQWLNFSDGRFQGDIFKPRRMKNLPPQIQWQDIRVNEALWDFDKMALQQFGGCSSMLETGGGGVLSVRCNYGSSIMMSLFGAEMYYMEDKYNTLPTSRPLNGGRNAIEALVQQGIPDIYGGLGEKVFAMGQYYRDVMRQYPNISKYVHIYHPDLQGPMDICEVLWGSSLFIDIMDVPELVHQFLQLITETYITFMEEWLKIVPWTHGYGVHWNMIHKGNLMIRDDSAMNLSPKMFDEFIKPYDQRLLDVFGGGAIHFCGRGDHYIKSASEMRGLYAYNMSQPEYNNMEFIYKNTIDKGIPLIGFSQKAAREAINQGRSLHGRVHS